MEHIDDPKIIHVERSSDEWSGPQAPIRFLRNNIINQTNFNSYLAN